MRIVLWVLALPLAVASTDGLAQKPKREKPAASQSAQPKLRPAAELFFEGYEHYKAGRLQQAEALFIGGLKQNSGDLKAWELLAEIQIALGKMEDAERTLSQAEARGLSADRTAALRSGFALQAPSELPRNLKASPDARAAVLSIKLPPSRAYFYSSETTTRENHVWTSASMMIPVPGGFRQLNRSRFVEAPGMAPRFINNEWLALVAGLVSLTSLDSLDRLTVTGPLFPLVKGNRFVLDYQKSSHGFDGSSIATKFVVSCLVNDVKPAIEFSEPNYPREGDLTSVSCRSSAVVGSKSIAPSDYGLMFSSRLGAFLSVSKNVSLTEQLPSEEDFKTLFMDGNAKMLVGTWQGRWDTPGRILNEEFDAYSWNTNYLSDGKYVATSKFERQGSIAFETRIQGRWAVEGAKLIRWCETRTSVGIKLPSYCGGQKPEEYEIDAIDSAKMEYRGARSGRKYTQTRAQ